VAWLRRPTRTRRHLAWKIHPRGFPLIVAAMDERPPFVVIEGRRSVVRARVEAALGEARAGHWEILRGWAAPLSRERVVCTGWIATPDDARRSLLAAVAGARLVVGCSIDRETLDHFLDDLRRLGPVDHVQITGPHERARLTRSERALMAHVSEGLTIREAAAEIGVARRTADRRLASVRDRLGVDSTSAAIAAARAKGR
jgi:DNA-binding CsgD family transcriptional regulator